MSLDNISFVTTMIRQDMETISSLLVPCEGNPWAEGGFPSQRFNNVLMFFYYQPDYVVELSVIWGRLLRSCYFILMTHPIREERRHCSPYFAMLKDTDVISRRKDHNNEASGYGDLRHVEK